MFVIFGVFGCSSPDSSGTTKPPPSTTPLSAELGVFVDEGMPLKPIAEGDMVPLWNATQGGHVLLVGARVKGLSGKIAQFRGRLRDPKTNEIVAEETRTVGLSTAPDDATVLIPDVTLRSQVANIPVCPDSLGRDMLSPYLLELVVTDPNYATSVTIHATVTPSCSAVPASDQASCACECAAGYTLGKCASAVK